MVAGLASTIFVPGAALLISSLGWRHALLILAVVQAATIIPHALLLRRRPADHGWLRDGVRRFPGPPAGSFGPAPAMLPDAAERAELAAAVRSRPVVLLTAGAVLGRCRDRCRGRTFAGLTAPRRLRPNGRGRGRRRAGSGPGHPAGRVHRLRPPPARRHRCCAAARRPGRRYRRAVADQRSCRGCPVRGLVRCGLRCPQHRPPGPPRPLRPAAPLRAAERRSGTVRDRRRGSRADRRRGLARTRAVTRPCSWPSPCGPFSPRCCSWRPTAPTAARWALSGRAARAERTCAPGRRARASSTPRCRGVRNR